MARLERVYEDLPKVIEEEKNRNNYKPKGLTIVQTTFSNSKIKHTYTGFCQKQGDTIVKMYPNADSLGKYKSAILKIIKKPLNKRQYEGYEWFKTCEL